VLHVNLNRMLRDAIAPLAAAALGVIVALAGCAGRHGPADSARQVRVEVANVGFDDESGTHFVLLEDAAGKRVLQILIGDEEARAIMFEMHGIKPDRPMTQDLLRKVIEQTGNHVERVVITGLHNEVYYADIYLDRGQPHLDSRPSDAIALAMGVGAPIFVADNLLQPATGVQNREASNASLPATFASEGIVVQALSTPIASYFGAEPQNGVLVASVTGSAARAGLSRGDIITAVEKHPVRAPTDFVAALAAARDRPTVALAVMRARRTVTITVPRGKVTRSRQPSRDG
jgi:uncharacterized protein